MKCFYCFLILIIGNAINSYSQSAGSNIFDQTGIHNIHISFSQENFWDSLMIYKEEGDISGDYKYMPAQVNFDGEIIDSTGVRLKGNSSFWTEGMKKSIKLKFNKYISGQKLDGLKKINLNNNFNDPTLMREKLFLDILQKNDVYAPRCTYSKVYINNVYWGLYTIVDHVDKVFLLSNFNDKSGNLFKGDKEPWLTCANLAYHQDAMEYRNCYTLETNEEINDWSDLENLIDIINNTPASNYTNILNSVLNTNSFINAWAANIVFVNVDSYVETGHNYYIYHNPISDKFAWITWDVNESFGLWNVGMPLEQLYNLDIFYLPENPMFERPLSYFMLQDSVFRKEYTNRLFHLVCNEFNPDNLYPKIDSLYNLIKDDVYLDTNKILSNQDFENNINNDVFIQGYPGWVPGLKNFIQDRHNILINQLSELGYNFPCNLNIVSCKKNTINFYPNPTYNIINVEFNNSNVISLEIINTTGELLLKKDFSNLHSEIINLSDFLEGVYFIKFISDDYSEIIKVVKIQAE